jgi:hypothetical protein
LAVTVIATGAFVAQHYTKLTASSSIESIESGAVNAEVVDLAALGDTVTWVVEAGAFEQVAEVVVGVGLSAGAIAYLAEIFSDLEMVQVVADPSDGGYPTGSGLYTTASSAELDASPNTGWRFTGWNDGDTNRVRTITVPDHSVTYTANYVKLSTVTGIANPTDAGTVDGGGTFEVGHQILLTATPAEPPSPGTEWEFVKWNDGTTNNPYLITVPDHDVTYTADFEEMVEVDAEADPAWGGTVSGGGSYPLGEPVSLIATPSSSWRFGGWFWENGSTNIPTIFVLAYPLTKPLKYRAEFIQTIQVTGLADPANAGSVAGSGVFDLDDTNITLTATASNNWVFVHWNDGATNNPYTIPPITDTNLLSITYTATFAPTATITTSATPPAGGSVTGGGTYPAGTSLPLTAVASDGWAFTGWNDGTTNNPYTITVPTTNITYTANFAASSRPTITTSFINNTLTLTWPSDHQGWILQAQTNGLSTHWFDLPGTTDVNTIDIHVDPANAAVFYRLRQP